MGNKQNAYLVRFKQGVSREIMYKNRDLSNIIGTRIRNSIEEKHTEKFHFRFITPSPFSKRTSHLFEENEFELA